MRHELLKTLALVACLLCSISAVAAEAYANYTPANTTLTFYYDNLRSSRTGATYDLNTGSQQPGWVVDETYSDITQVVFNSSFAEARPVSTHAWFFCMANVQSITGLEYLNTSEVTKMGAMFMGCESMTSLDLRHFNTEKVTDMFNMFNGCCNLTSIDMRGFNTAKVIDMRGMFLECSKLTSLDLSSFNTAKVENMNNLFNGDSRLTTIFAGDEWSTAALNYSNDMFTGCTSLVGGMGTTYDANHVDKAYAHIDGGPSNPGYFSAAAEAYACYTSDNNTLTFYYDGKRSTRSGTIYDLNEGYNYPGWHNWSHLVQLVVFDPSFAAARPTTTYRWFSFMFYLSSISGIENLNTSQVTNMAYMFGECGCKSLDLSSFNTANVTDMSNMFSSCQRLTSLDLSSFNTANVTDMSNMFNNCQSLTSLDLSSFNTANVTNMCLMFNYCYALTSLDVSSFNTANVTNMFRMFYECKALTSLDLSSFNTANVTDMGCMFYKCTDLANLNLSGFNTTNVTNMNSMFSNCTNLTSLDLSHFNNANVTTMREMFYGCKGLTSLDLSGFNTENVTNMVFMFNDCQSLTSLDISSFNTAKVEEMTGMFSNCKELTTIYAGDGWSMDALINHNTMFNGSTKLVGGMGTTYDYVNVGSDYTFAHIDGGPSNPGYFSAVPEAYACYTPENTTLTFYYDSQRSGRTGSTFDLPEGEVRPDWYSSVNSKATQVVFDPSFAAARPTTTYYWFWQMRQLTTITGLEYLNTSQVTNMGFMFKDCNQLTSLDLRSFNTENVTNMSGMFTSCSHLTSIDLSSWNTAKVTDMSMMFWFCSALTTIYAGSEWTTAAVTSSSTMFGSCSKLVGGKGTKFDSRYTDKTYARIDRGQSYPGYFTEKSPEAYAVYTPENTTLTFYYDTRNGSRPGTNYELVFDDEGYMIWYYDIYSSVTQVVFDPSFADARPTSTNAWFAGLEHLESIIGMKDYLNTSEVTDMSYMFAWCEVLPTLDVSNFNTEKVVNMAYMFCDCQDLTSLDVSNFNTEKVTNMRGMFSSCSGLTSLDVSSFNTEKVTNMESMFSYCPKLTSLDLSNFNTEKVTNMRDMFKGCSNLTSIDLSSFNTANVTSMSYMFYKCSNLTSLDLSRFNTAKVIYTNSMFEECNKLNTIYAGSGWSTAAVTDSYNMFLNCTNLVGGMGTAYRANNPDDKTYAHIDGGPENPGYLTWFLKGDVDNDGIVTIGDVADIVDMLLSGTANVETCPAADVDGDGIITVGDVADVIDYLLNGYWN